MFFLRWQVAQGVHLLEDRMKKANKEASGEKAIQQVSKTTLQEKNWEVSQAEKKPVAAKRARASTDQKMEVLQGMVKESNTKLAQALSIIMARYEELAPWRGV